MFINFLFLSRLLNPNTGKQSVNNTGDGFSYLFSEIIKIKTEETSPNVVTDNIDGTLLDHKMVLISKSSPMESMSADNANQPFWVFEELNKFFPNQNHQVYTKTNLTHQTTDKLTADKNQFISGIVSLIRNILNNNGSSEGEVEIRYVIHNMIEAKKVNKNNLNQFSEFLSSIIDNSQSFSFVIGFNSKQILFDVENLSVDVKDKNNPLINQNTEISSIDSAIVSESETNTLGDNHESVSSDSPKDFDRESNKLSSLANTKTDLTINQSDDTINNNQKLIFNQNKKFNDDVTNQGKENYRFVKEIKSENEKLSSAQSVAEDKSTSANISSNSSEGTIEFISESNFKSYDSYKMLKTDKPELNLKGLGEVKVLIKENLNYQEVRVEAPVKIEHSFKESFVTNNQLARIYQGSDLQSVKFEKQVIPTDKNYQMLLERDLPGIIQTQSNEPKISKVAMPLIVDYQDWDLVFEKSATQIHQPIQAEKTFLKSNSKVEIENQIQNQKLFVTKTQNEIKSNSEISTNKIEPESPRETKSLNPQEKNKEIPEQADSTDKWLHLKLTNEKKIIAVSDVARGKTILSSEEVNIKSSIQNIPNVNENKISSISSTKSLSEGELSDTPAIEAKEINSHSTEKNIDNNFKNPNQNSSDKKENPVEFKKVDDNTSQIEENHIKPELNNSTKQFIQSEAKPHIINNKTIVEQFIKNPAESVTVKQFLQVLDNQEVIQKSEIINYSKQNHSVEIKLAPEDLGKIKILIDTNDNDVTARIEVGNDQTKAIIANNIPLLKESLTQQGINLNSVNVTVSSEEQRNPEQTRQKSKKKSQNENSKVELSSEKKTVRNLGYNTYEYLA